MTRSSILLLILIQVVPTSLIGRQKPPSSPITIEHEVRRVSNHVWVIDGSKSKGVFPNIGMIVGSRATLIVDTGIGNAAGEIVLSEARKLRKNTHFYLTFTHFHTEHASGAWAFPENTTLVYSEAEQEDIRLGLAAHIARVSANSPSSKELLRDWKLRPPDILFEREIRIDLGGVVARLVYFGPGHTHGDTLIFIEDDSVLLPGDIVQIRMFPNISYRLDATAGVGPSALGWLRVLDKVADLRPKVIVPDHGEFPGDASLIVAEREYLQLLTERVRQLKAEGKSAEQAGTILTVELQAKYPDWTGSALITPAVQRLYSELP